jgi:hypothetical protein
VKFAKHVRFFALIIKVQKLTFLYAGVFLNDE